VKIALAVVWTAVHCHVSYALSAALRSLTRVTPMISADGAVGGGAAGQPL